MNFFRSKTLVFNIISTGIHILVLVLLAYVVQRGTEFAVDVGNFSSEFRIVSANKAQVVPSKGSSKGNFSTESKESSVSSSDANSNSVAPASTGAVLGEGAIAEVSRLYSKPRVIKEVKAEYPEKARAARQQGVVRMQVLVGLDGHVKDVRILEGPSEELNLAAQKALQQFEFSEVQAPEGIQAYQLIYKYNFKLETQ